MWGLLFSLTSVLLYCRSNHSCTVLTALLYGTANITESSVFCRVRACSHLIVSALQAQTLFVQNYEDPGTHLQCFRKSTSTARKICSTVLRVCTGTYYTVKFKVKHLKYSEFNIFQHYFYLFKKMLSVSEWPGIKKKSCKLTTKYAEVKLNIFWHPISIPE